MAIIFFALEAFKEIFEHKPADIRFEDWYKQHQTQDTLHIPLRVAQLIERRFSKLIRIYATFCANRQCDARRF